LLGLGRMKSHFISPFRFYLTFFAVTFAFCSLGGRLVYLQVFKGDDYTELANQARKNFIEIKARRGDIVDSKGNLLATTRSVVEVGMDPHSVKEDDWVKFDRLAVLLDVNPDDIRTAAKNLIRRSGTEDMALKKVRWVKLKDEVEEDVYREIRKLEIKGVYGNFKHSRLYPNKNLASHLLGFVNKEGVAAMGTESHADYYLKGQDGWRESEKDGERREMPQHRSFEVQARDGLNVELSIDRMIQDMVETELKAIVEEYEPISASIIVSDPKTGYVLALGNVPDFDLNKFNKADHSQQRNRALADVYEPGSTFKIVAVTGAMNEGLVDADDLIDCSIATVQRGSRRMRLPSDHHDLGQISVSKVVQKSSNRGAAQLGIMLGSQRLYDYCKAFGFGQKTNFGIGGESRGVLHHPKRWDGLTITRLPMGHAVSATAMQVHSSMGAVANGGILMKPQFIHRIFDSEGKTVVSFNPKPVRRVIASGVTDSVTEMLVSVVSAEGTAAQARIEGFDIAGKTGTTKKLIEGQYSNRHHVASFVGFFPAEDPQIVITVVVDEPKMKAGRTGYGGVVAAPAFQRVGKGIIAYLGLKPKPKEPKTFAQRKRSTRSAL
jgi:cell division protein FtsI/penicillin-binding protein 2